MIFREDSCLDPKCYSEVDGLCRIYSRNRSIVCSCCPARNLTCTNCGGNVGGGLCKGVSTQDAIAFQGCPCLADDGSGGGTIPPVFPIPPAGFPFPPPGTSPPSDGGKNCPTTPLPSCSDCKGSEGWCQSGSNVRYAHPESEVKSY
jgi:hypothetical protein